MSLGVWGDLAVAGAGVAAGAVNTIVGSGSLLTFPTLVALGFSPLVANVTNTVGIVPGSISGAIGYRRELEGQRPRALRLGLFSLAGGLAGAVLLLTIPGSFQAVVPWLVLLAVGMVIVQPRLARWMASRGRQPSAEHGGYLLWAGIFATGVYGGYFGAAQGVLLIGMLGLAIDEHVQRLNALKNVLAAIVNGVAAILFMIYGPVSWGAALILAGGSIVGGQIGARVGRRLPPRVLRAVIIVAGTAVAIKLLV